MSGRVRYGLGALLLAAGCGTPSTPPPEPELQRCPRVALFASEAEMAAALPGLYERYRRDLIVAGTGVYVAVCSNPQLGGVEETSQLDGATESSELDGATDSTELAGAETDTALDGAKTDTEVAGAETDSRIAGAGTDTEIAGAETDTRVDGATDASRIGGASAETKVDGATDSSRIGGAVDLPRIDGAVQTSRIAGATGQLRCAATTNELGYRLNYPGTRPLRLFDGARLWQVSEAGVLTPLP